jgi:hypothetical protein
MSGTLAMTAAADAPPASGPEAAIEGTYQPWRERPLSAAAALIFAVTACVLVQLASGSSTLAAVLAIAFAAQLAPAWFPTRVRVDRDGVAARGAFGWERRAWSRPTSPRGGSSASARSRCRCRAGTVPRCSPASNPSCAPVTSPDPAFAPEDLDLLDRIAARVVELRMETPAILTLEGGRPLTLVASQAMIFFEPMVAAFFRLPDYRRFATLVERRETVEHLLQRIESRAEAARDERAAARRASAGPRPGSGSGATPQ